MKYFTRTKNRRAFSIIEVAVAASLLALVSAGMLAILDRGFIAARKASQYVVAYNVAKQVMEEYSDWGELVTRTGSDPPVNGTYTAPPAAITINSITYTPSLNISEGPCVTGMALCPPNSELKQVSVTVTFGTYAISLTDLKANF